MGIVLSKEVLSALFNSNLDKNYLTELELAALLDNHVVTINFETAEDFLHRYGARIHDTEGAQVIAKAVHLANLARG